MGQPRGAQEPGENFVGIENIPRQSPGGAGVAGVTAVDLFDPCHGFVDGVER